MKKRMLAIALSAAMMLTAIPVSAGEVIEEQFVSLEEVSRAESLFSDGSGVQSEEAVPPVEVRSDDETVMTPKIDVELLEGGTDNLIEWDYANEPLEVKLKVTITVPQEPVKNSGMIVWNSRIELVHGDKIIYDENLVDESYQKNSNGGYECTEEISFELDKRNGGQIDGNEHALIVKYTKGKYSNIQTATQETNIRMKVNPYMVTWWTESAPTEYIYHDTFRINDEMPKKEDGTTSAISGQLWYFYKEVAEGETQAPDVSGETFSANRTPKSLKEDTAYWIWKRGELKEGYGNNISDARQIRTKAVKSISSSSEGNLTYTIGNKLAEGAGGLLLNLRKLTFHYTDDTEKSGYSISNLGGSWVLKVGDKSVVLKEYTVSADDHEKELKLVYTKTNGSSVECKIGTLKVNKKSQTSPITVTAPDELSYGDGAFELQVSGGDGTGAYSYKVTEGTEVLGVREEGKLEILGAGQAKVVVTKGEDEEYKEKESEPVMISIGKAQPSIKLADDWFYTGSIYLNPVVTGVEGGKKPTGTVTYNWYEDKEGTELLNGDGSEPKGTGTYYVKAKLGEDNNYLSAESDIAEIQIRVYIPPQPTPEPTPEPIPDNYPDGSKRNPDGSIETPNGTVVKEDGTIVLPDGTELKPDESGNKPSIDKDNHVTDTNGTVIDKDGNITLPGDNVESKEDDTTVTKGDGEKAPVYDPDKETVTVNEGNKVILPNGETMLPPAGSEVGMDGTVTEPDGTVNRPDGTVVESDGTRHNPDGSIQSPDGEYIKPARPILESAEVYATGNRVKAVLSGECAGAEGYDYVISRNKDCIIDKDYLSVSKNIKDTETSFFYIPKGTYYVYCHAWFKNKDGIKVFSEWSNYRTVEVKSVTPSKSVIRSVKVKGDKISVTYTRSKNAAGYDLVLGSRVQKVNGEKRPVDYGKRVKKIKNGKTTTTIFRNAKKGTYYLGLHAYNRTSPDKKKVFSPWSNIKKVSVR